MRRTASLTWILVLLVLVPSAVLSWLGLRSVESFEASELARLRAEVAAKRDQILARVPAAKQAMEARIQHLVAHAAAEVGVNLPRCEGIGAGEYLAHTCRGIGQSTGLEIVEQRVLDASGHVVFPRPYVPRDREAPASEAPGQEDLLDHLRVEADRAWYGPGGADAALDVWREAARHATGKALRLRIDVEMARLRARADSTGEAAGKAADLLEEKWGVWDVLRRVPRATLLLWASAAASSPMWQARVQTVARDGTMDGIPLTAEERRRLRRAFGPRPVIPTVDDPYAVPGDLDEHRREMLQGAFDALTPAQRQAYERALRGRWDASDAATVTYAAPLPAGCRLQVRVRNDSLSSLFAMHLPISWSPLVPIRAWVRVPGQVQYEELVVATFWPTSPEEERFFEAGHSVIDVALHPDVTVHVHILAERWRSARSSVRTRRLWTICAIVVLFLVTSIGLLLIRRAVIREREARRLRDDFIANVTHEVRTPLTSVLLHGEMLAAEDTPPDKRREHAEVVKAEGQRLAALVDDMLDFAALERGTRSLEVAPVDLAAACREAIAPYHVLAEREGARVEGPAGEGEVAAMADPAALARVLSNLVGNAWKHGRPSKDGGPGRIRIQARMEEHAAVVEVRDDGPGIPAEERAQVFERFGRGRRARDKGGSGIGLALSRDLARAMDGDLVVDTRAGETVFRLTLPAVPDLELP